MFPQFGATAESISKASSLVFRIGTDAHLYDDPEDANIASLLDSRFESEKAEALKRLLALIAQGADVSNFFPQVVKNVASHSLEVKKLVYLYLLHYAEKRPNEALLSINCFQKDLSDTNPLVRAWALRAMAGIRLHAVAPIVLVAAGKCARDPSAYVRKCAAHSLSKIYDLQQEENIISLEELVSILLNDHSPGVVGAAAVAFRSVCPNNLSLIGKYFRKLCETLPDVEEWAQIVLIEILLRYVVAKHGLVKESIMLLSNSTLTFHTFNNSLEDSSVFNSHHHEVSDVSDFKLSISMLRNYIEGQEEQLSCSGLTNENAGKLDDVVVTSSQNDDVKILLRCTSPLLWSQNSGVVLAASGVHWIMAPKEEVNRVVKPLLFIMRSSKASKYVVLCNIQVFARVVPALFSPYFEDFFICSSDSYQMKALKLEILSTIATDSSVPIIFEEFQDYIRDPDRRFAADTVAAIGLCAQRLPSVVNSCLEGLLALIVQESSISNLNQMGREPGVLVQAVMSVKTILKQNPAGQDKVIVRLACLLDVIKEPTARALIIWIVGEYSSDGQIILRILPTLFKYLAWCFTSEDVETKLQILNSSAKVLLGTQGEQQQSFKIILGYVVELAKYDVDYDVRDRARIIEKFVLCRQNSSVQEEDSCLQQDGDVSYEFAANLFTGSVTPLRDPPNNFRFYLPGSLSQIVLHAAPGYVLLPKPCTLLYNDLDSGVVDKAEVPDDNTRFEMNDPDSFSGSSVEESGSYDSHPSVASSSDTDGTDGESDLIGDGHSASILTIHGPKRDKEIPLVHLSDVADRNIGPSFPTDLAELMSKSALESWLDEKPALSSTQKSDQLSSAKISITDLGFIVKPMVHTLIDPANSNGLIVECCFSSEASEISHLLICVEFTFGNCSSVPLVNIAVKDGEPTDSKESSDKILTDRNGSPTIIHPEEIASLDPGQTTKRILQIHFHHHLLPLKVAVFCNGQKYLAKLWPDIGYFLRPLSLDIEAFLVKESQLPGMFEYSRRCMFTEHMKELECEDQSSFHADKILVVARCIASKMLSNANVHLVSADMPVSFNVDDASGLCLRFSGEILSSSKPCLITIIAEGKCSGALNATVKVNCEESIFGLNMLNRIVAFLD